MCLVLKTQKCHQRTLQPWHQTHWHSSGALADVRHPCAGREGERGSGRDNRGGFVSESSGGQKNLHAGLKSVESAEHTWAKRQTKKDTAIHSHYLFMCVCVCAHSSFTCFRCLCAQTECFVIWCQLRKLIQCQSSIMSHLINTVRNGDIQKRYRKNIQGTYCKLQTDILTPPHTISWGKWLKQSDILNHLINTQSSLSYNASTTKYLCQTDALSWSQTNSATFLYFLSGSGSTS